MHRVSRANGQIYAWCIILSALVLRSSIVANLLGPVPVYGSLVACSNTCQFFSLEYTRFMSSRSWCEHVHP
ncbi:hypothetical protein RSAG8_05484, partial [Rhizoctonia solani AG-8 WAC10335]